MSTRDDASLTAKERAALASLEAKAAAEDPQWATRLRGSSGLRWLARLPRMPVWLRYSWLGGPVLAVGLLLMILSMSAGLLVGVAGALLATGGLGMLAGLVDRRWIRTRPPSDPRSAD